MSLDIFIARRAEQDMTQQWAKQTFLSNNSSLSMSMMRMEQSSDILLADLFVQNTLIIELKAVKTLADEHTAQALGYLRASNTRHGLLINFGNPVFQIKKLIL